MIESPPYPAHWDDGVWYCDAHNAYACLSCVAGKKACSHGDLHYFGRNEGVYCRFCGKVWRRTRTENGPHLMLTEEIRTAGVLYGTPFVPWKVTK